MRKLFLFFFFIFLLLHGEEKIEEVRRLYLTKEYDNALDILAREYETATEAERPYIQLEMGDIYLDKKRDFDKAEEIYNGILRSYPNLPETPDILYRLALLAERKEDFVTAASLYEKIATQYLRYEKRYRFPFKIERKERKPKYMDDALEAIERTFKKNYQERVAYVDGYPITQVELDERVLHSPTGGASFEEKKKELERLIEDRLLYQRALRSGYAQKEDFRKTIDDVRRRFLFSEWYNQEVVNQASVSEKEKRAYYQAHQSDYITEEQVKGREILVRDLSEAMALRAKIISESLSFDSAAKAFSLAPSKDKGGDLGWVKRKSYPKNVEKVLFKLKPKEISQPVKTQDGYLLLKVEERKEYQKKRYKEVAGEIEARLRQEKIQKGLEERLRALKEKGKLVIDTNGVKEGKETLGYVFNIPLTKTAFEERVAQIPAFFRGDLETPEGKLRFLGSFAEEYMVLYDCENKKYWLKNSVYGQLLEEEKRILINQLRKGEVSDKAVVSEEEAKKEYQSSLKDFYVPDQVKAREIVCRSKEQALAAKKMLEEKKVSFDSVVKEYSVAPSKWIGGDLGYFSKDDTLKPKPVRDFAFKAKPGKISDVMKINDTTFVIIKVEEQKKAYTRPFSEVRAKIERKLKQEKEDRLYQELIAELKREAKIEILLSPEEKKEEE
ncbi:MAG: peptidyl-prolyl cis-trans isomerase [candidate division WOR-3 bacterium]